MLAINSLFVFTTILVKLPVLDIFPTNVSIKFHKAVPSVYINNGIFHNACLITYVSSTTENLNVHIFVYNSVLQIRWETGII